jgi:hypothetical protein
VLVSSLIRERHDLAQQAEAYALGRIVSALSGRGTSAWIKSRMHTLKFGRFARSSTSKRGRKFSSKVRGIVRIEPEADQHADVPDDGVADRGIQLTKVLMSEHKGNPPLDIVSRLARFSDSPESPLLSFRTIRPTCGLYLQINPSSTGSSFSVLV